MGAPGTHRSFPAQGQAPADVLAGADEDDLSRAAPWAAALVVALLVGAVVDGRSSEPAPRPLVLRAGELVLRDRVVDHRLAEAGLHVEVVNAGAGALDLRQAALVPGAWEVEVVDRTLLLPGESVVLSLHRTVVCDERASYGPVPEHLVLTALAPDGDDLVVRLPVADPAAYGGRLDDVLRDPGRACSDEADDVGGPLGDLVGSWRARRAWPPPAG